jgi:hypothetical protein
LSPQSTIRRASVDPESPVTPKFISRSDPATQWAGKHKGHAFFACAANYLIDTDHGVIVDVEATRVIRQAEVGAARTMLKRTETRFGIKPAFLTSDSAYGSADSLAWLVKRKGIAPQILVFDKSNRTDGTFPPARTLPSIPNATATRARRTKSFSNFDALTQPREAASRPRVQDSIAPANWIATSANSSHTAAPMK